MENEMHKLQADISKEATCENMLAYAPYLGVRDFSDEGMGAGKQNFDVEVSKKYEDMLCQPTLKWDGSHEK